jgi:hypothetical protein
MCSESLLLYSQYGESPVTVPGYSDHKVLLKKAGAKVLQVIHMSFVLQIEIEPVENSCHHSLVILHINM